MRSMIFVLILISSFVAQAQDPIKVGHMAVPIHEQIMRSLTRDHEVIIISRPGGKGIIAYNALEKNELDFLVVTNSAAVLTPLMDRDVFAYMPAEKFRFISTVAVYDPVLLVSPAYKNVDDLVAAKKKNREPVITAGSGDESSLLTRAYFKALGLDVTYVMYNNAGAPLVDVLAGRTDVMFTTEFVAQPHVSKGASIIKLRDSRGSPVSRVQLNVFLVTRRDMPQYKIDGFLQKLRGRIKEIVEQNKLNNVTLLVSSEKDTQERLTDYKNVMEELLKKSQ